MLIQYLFYIPVLIILVGITLFLFSRNIRSSINLTFGLFTLSTTLWLFCLFQADTTTSANTALVWTRLAVFFTCFIPLCFLAFVKVFPEDHRLRLKPLLIYIFVTVILAAFSFSDYMVSEVEIAEYTSAPTTVGPAYTAFFVYLAIYFLIAFILLIKKLNRVTSTQRNQIRLVLFGTATGVFTNVLFNVFFVIVGISGIGLLFGGPSVLLFTILVVYAIVRHRLFDIRLIVTRTIAYLFALFGLITIYGAFVWISSRTVFVGEQLSSSRQIFYVSMSVFAGLIAVPLKKYFDKVTNKLFYRDAYDAQAFLDELNKELVSNIDLESLLKKCSEIIASNLKPEYCAFGLKETAYSPQRVIGDTSKDFRQEDIELVRSNTPLTKQTVLLSDELDDESELKSRLRKYDIAILSRLATDLDLEIEGLGYLIMGQKKSGNPYNKQDLRIIEIITNELVIAIQNALRFEEIEKFNVTLQEKVDNATAELKRTNDRLKELDETKDEFISMASHQLRTPLTSVKGYLSMVLEGDVGDVPDQQRRMLDQAYVSSQRMVYLIADLLNVSRLKTGKFIIDTKPTNLAEVVEGEVSQLIDTAKSRKLELHYDKPDDFPVVMLDETKIRQVIMNFIDNAIYYTPAGGRIDVSVAETDKTIEYRVKDNGIGVPKSERHHLFNKFYRAGNARKARPDGTGLGLFMAKKVIVAQAGAVIFETEEGKGSTFGFIFDKQKILPSNADNKPSEEKPQPQES